MLTSKSEAGLLTRHGRDGKLSDQQVDLVALRVAEAGVADDEVLGLGVFRSLGADRTATHFLLVEGHHETFSHVPADHQPGPPVQSLYGRCGTKMGEN